MTKQEMAMSFLKMAAAGEVRNAFEKFVAPEFIHHNQYFKGDRQSLMMAMEDAAKNSPNKTIEVRHVYQDGDTVITHSHVVRQDPGALGIAVVHIFKFKNDKIVELWDLGQEIMRNGPNENGPF